MGKISQPKDHIGADSKMGKQLRNHFMMRSFLYELKRRRVFDTKSLQEFVREFEKMEIPFLEIDFETKEQMLETVLRCAGWAEKQLQEEMEMLIDKNIFASKPHVHVTATWVHLQTYADALNNGAGFLMMIAYAVMMEYVDKQDLTALNVPIEIV